MTSPYTHTWRSGNTEFYNIPWPQIAHDIPIIISQAGIQQTALNTAPPLVDLRQSIFLNDAVKPQQHGDFFISPRGGWGLTSCMTDVPPGCVRCHWLMISVLLGRRARELYLEIWPYEA